MVGLGASDGVTDAQGGSIYETEFSIFICMSAFVWIEFGILKVLVHSIGIVSVTIVRRLT